MKNFEDFQKSILNKMESIENEIGNYGVYVMGLEKKNKDHVQTIVVQMKSISELETKFDKAMRIGMGIIGRLEREGMSPALIQETKKRLCDLDDRLVYAPLKEPTQLEIPKMTHPLSKHWKQPDVSRIQLIDDTAIMSEDTRNELANYSASQPSGVYEGKMWRCKFDGEWFLRWYSYASDKMCSTNTLEIKLKDL